MKFKPLAWIPNTHGFPCTVITADGVKHRVRVVKCNSTGCYRLDLPDGVAFSDLKGWHE